MERRALGASDLEITPVGVGTAPIGSLPGVWWVNWGHQDEEEAVGAIDAALEAGVNWIDTAPFYGWGRAEEIVGRAIRSRDDVLVFTKCGTMRRADGDDYMDLRPEAIRADVEASLRRLGVERIDLLQVHDRDPSVPIEETWGAVLELVAEGSVRHGGISNHRPEEVERALVVGPVAALQHEYSAIARDLEDAILPLAHRRGLGVIVWAPLASGFLTDGFSVDRLEPDDFRRTHRFAELELDPLRALLRGADRTSAQGAIAFVLSHPAVTGAIVGVRNEREAGELPRAASMRLTADELAAVKAIA
ncbi:MAG TPA: aldo/keto reductase [Gaiellaceae bacterium]|nr:aldo/keto reductase [Gaiellaceae bacterium]